jgi:hypothetical protein
MDERNLSAQAWNIRLDVRVRSTVFAEVMSEVSLTESIYGHSRNGIRRHGEVGGSSANFPRPYLRTDCAVAFRCADGSEIDDGAELHGTAMTTSLAGLQSHVERNPTRGVPETSKLTECPNTVEELEVSIERKCE